MITVGMYYDVVAGREREFEEKFAEVAGILRGQPGHVQSLLYRQVTRPSSYAIFSEWESRQAFQAFLRGDLFRSVAAWGRAGILETRPRHRVYGQEEDLA